MLKAITFDFWDTLYKVPEGLIISGQRVAAFNQIVRTMGYEVENDAVQEAFQDCWQYAHEFQLDYGMDITPTGHVDFILGQLQIKLGPEDWERVYKVYTSVLIDFPPQLKEGVKETLPLLARKYKLAVICNTGVTPGLILREIMKADDIHNFFNVLVFSDEVRWAKPNVKIFNYALQNLQVKNIEAAHIGDDSRIDVIGAKKAGMTAIWIAPEAVQETPDCDFQVRSVKELITLFAD
ncbi:MAG: HAD family hydrolase [Syntrophomonas sp.]|nr:HAD family hydrolase [Syntrophomonas sp.]